MLAVTSVVVVPIPNEPRVKDGGVWERCAAIGEIPLDRIQPAVTSNKRNVFDEATREEIDDKPIG